MIIACRSRIARSPLAPPALAANPQVELDTTLGKIRIELYPDAAPKTVANFLEYVKDKLLQRHAIPPRDPRLHGAGRRLHAPSSRQKPTRPPVPIEAEISQQGRACPTSPGTVAMARTCDPNSATAQFFINVADNKALNFRSPDRSGYGYTAFGKVVEGMDVVNKIAEDRRPGGGGPFPGPTLIPRIENVLINSAEVVDAANDEDIDEQRRSCTPTSATSRSSSIATTRRPPSTTSSSTSATATTTTRCSIA